MNSLFTIIFCSVMITIKAYPIHYQRKMNKKTSSISLMSQMNQFNLDSLPTDNRFSFLDINRYRFILGTESKIRRYIVDRMGCTYDIMVPNIDEKLVRSDDPMILPVLISRAKAKAILSKLKDLQGIDDGYPQKDSLIITMDQIVLFDNEIREKPSDLEEARRFLASYSTAMVSLIGGVVITHYPSGFQRTASIKSTVYWDAISQEVIERVLARGEVLQCAGGFQLEDPDLNPLIVRIEGSIDAVLGFPIELTARLMEELLHDISSKST